MTPEREAEIKAASARVERANIAVQASMAMNVPREYGERIEAAQSHALRLAELSDAHKDLRRIIDDVFPDA